MYPTSEAYKTAISSLTRTTKVDGTMKLTNGTIVRIDDDDIMAGTLKIDNACVNGNDFEIGAVYMGELSFNIYTEIDRYTLYGAEINLTYKIQTGINQWEQIPLGTFYVVEATRKNKSITIKAYDSMSFFDVKLTNITYGTPWELINHICRNCGVEFGNTRAEIDALSPRYVNREIIFLKIDEDDYITCRDMLADAAGSCGGFATIGRDNKLYIKRYGQDSITLSQNHIKSAGISDYKVKYDGVYCDIDRKEYFAGAENGYRYYLQNKLWNTGTEVTKQLIVDHIWNVIQDIEYTPVDLKYDGDPSIDLGDSIIFNDGDLVVNSFVMKNIFNYKNIQNIKGVGNNPLLQDSETSEQRRTTITENEIKAGFFNIVTFENSIEYDITQEQGEVVVADFDVALRKENPALLIGQAELGITGPCEIKAIYEVNDVLLTWTPETHFEAGKYILNFYAPLYLWSVTLLNNIVIKLQITELNPGEEPAHVTLDATKLNVSVFGSIIESDGTQFTGYIEIEENMRLCEIGHPESVGFGDSVNIDLT